MGLGVMKYKSFSFPNNPETSGFECDRSYVKHKYPELAGNELEDFGTNAVVITGSGEFFGDDAYEQWDKLLAEFNKSGVGKFSHPIYTTVTRGLMTKLKSDLEPRENYIKYSFEIVADTEPQIKKDTIVKEKKKTTFDVDNLKVGDVVNFTGTKHYTSSYSDAKAYSCKPGKAKVTKIADGHTHPFHLIKINGGGSTVYGWVDSKYINAKVTSTKDSDHKVVHKVAKGECLSKICAYYSKKYDVDISWKEVATYNKLKNPSVISIGQKITIVW